MDLKQAIGKINLDVNILQFYNEQIVPLNPSLHMFLHPKDSVICPFHKDVVPSFSHWQATNKLHCFGCGADYHVVSLFITANRLWAGVTYTEKQAVEKLSKLYHLDIELDAKPQNVFEECRKNMLEARKPAEGMTLAKLLQRNHAILSAKLPLDTAIPLLYDLDCRAADYYMRKES